MLLCPFSASFECSKSPTPSNNQLPIHPLLCSCPPHIFHMDMRRLRSIVWETMQLVAMAAWGWSKKMSLSSKLGTMLVIGMILRSLLRVLGPARRRSTHWLIQYGAWAALYLPIPLATYALGIICSSPHLNMSSSYMNTSIVQIWGFMLTLLVTRHRESMKSYMLGDTLQHGWRHAQVMIYPMYWFYTYLTVSVYSVYGMYTYNKMLLLLICLVSFMGPLVFELTDRVIFVKSSNTVIPIPNIDSSRQSEKLAKYMKLESRSGEPFFDHGEINLENCIYPFEWRCTCQGWITIKDVFLLDSVDRDICLSYTFFNMIKRRFYGFDCAEEDEQRVRTFVLRELLAGENGLFTNRAFKVVEVQLSFLYDHLFTEHSSIIYCMHLVAGDGPISHPYVLAFWVAFLAVLVRIEEWVVWLPPLLLTIDVVLEELQGMYYLASDWYEVWYAFRCDTESINRRPKPSYRPSAKERLAGWLRNTGLFTRQQYWQNKIGQYSLLEDYDRVLSAKKKLVVLATGFVLGEKYDFIRHHPLEEDPVSLSDSVKELVARTLRVINGRPTNGSRSLERYRERAQESNPDRVPDDLSWTLTQETHTHTILIWHIATCYCKMIGVEESPDFEVAETLSGYCAYLVAFLPELLPEHSVTSTRVLQLVLEQAQRLLGKTGSMEEKRTKIQGLQLPEEEGDLTAFEKGVKLGRQLERLVTLLRWTVMAEFWAETMLYVAPSDNVKAHVEQLSKGGEFVTHVWALLSNAGILKRAAG